MSKTTHSTDLSPLRALTPYMREASRLWRAGKPFSVVRKAFPATLRVTLFGRLESDSASQPLSRNEITFLNQRLLDLIAAVRNDPMAPPTWDFPARPDGCENAFDEQYVFDAWIWQHADKKDLPHNWGNRMDAQQAMRDARHSRAEHQRTKLGEFGRPCQHNPVFDSLDNCTYCDRCGVEMTFTSAPKLTL